MQKIIKNIHKKLEQYIHFVSFCLSHSKESIVPDNQIVTRTHWLDCQKKYFKTDKKHHRGYFLRILSENRLKESQVNKWSTEVLDLFVLGFFVFLEKGYNWDSVYEQESGDIDLLASCLLPNHNKPLMPTSIKKSFSKHFYKYTYPALQSLIKNKEDMWLRHGPEKLNRRKKMCCKDDDYPFKYWSCHKEKGFWSIEIGKLPFSGSFPSQKNYIPWGIIPLSEFKKFNGIIDHMPNRDHCAAKAKIPLKNWLFLLSDEFKMGEREWKLINWSKGCIDYKIANQFIGTLNDLSSLLKSFQITGK